MRLRGAGAAVEYAALVVDNAGAAIASHAAAAQRMRRRRLVAHQRAGERVGHVGATGLHNQRLDGGADALVDGLVLQARPFQGDTVVLQHEVAPRAIVRDRKEGLQAGERPVVDAGHQAFQGAEHAPVREEQRR